jgi:hypothetical protein
MTDNPAELLQIDAAGLREPHRLARGGVTGECQHVAGQLHSRASPRRAGVNDHGPHLFERRLDPLVHLAVGADHDGQLTLLGGTAASGNRRVDDMNILRPQFIGEFDRRLRADGRMDRDDGSGLGVRCELTDDLAHLYVVEDGHADDVGDGDVGDAVRQGRPHFGQRRHSLGANIENHYPARPFDEALGHRRAHIAEADVAELQVLAHQRMICPPSTLKIWPVTHLA